MSATAPARPTRPRSRPGWVAVLLLALWLLLPAAPAAAHVGLEDSSPAASAVLDEPPDEIRLDFAGAVESRLASVELFDQNASRIPLGAPRHDPADRSVLVAENPLLGDGVYVVTWRVTSTDGYPADGAFTFQVGEQEGGEQVDVADLLARVVAGRHADPAVGWSLGIARWVGLLGVIVLVGATGFAATTPGVDPRREPLRRLLWSGWTASLVGSIGVLVLHGPHVTRRSLGDALDPGLWGEVLGTRAGRALELRWALLLGAGYLLTVLARHRERWWRLAGAAVAVGLAATYGLAGHAGASGRARFGPAAGVPLDALHLLAASAWLGGLMALLALRPPDPPVVRRFSSVAAVAVPLVVITGVLQALRLRDSSAAGIGDTAWGRVLLVKLVLVAVVVVIAAAARWLLAAEGSASVGRLVVTEVVLGVLVVALSASLVALPPRGETAARPVTATLVEDSVLLEVTVTPARLGANEVHLVFVPPGGSLQPLVEAASTLVAEMPSTPPVEVELSFAGPNHWSGLVRVPSPGPWILEVEAVDQDGRVLRYELPMAVER